MEILPIVIGIVYLTWYIICAPVTTLKEIIHELIKNHRLSFTSVVVGIMELVLSTLVILSAINIIASLIQTFYL